MLAGACGCAEADGDGGDCAATSSVFSPSTGAPQLTAAVATAKAINPPLNTMNLLSNAMCILLALLRCKKQTGSGAPAVLPVMTRNCNYHRATRARPFQAQPG